MPTASQISNDLSNKILEVLRPLVHDRSGYGLVDFPFHFNIGDSAIWVGEIELLKRLHGSGPRYVAHKRYSPSEPRWVMPSDAVLYIHGGGNFGDIWIHHQRYREAILQANPDLRIIQLPQSLHFKKTENIERTKRIIGEHKDFHLMVRDQESFDFSRRHFDCPVYLAPDSAFGIDMSRFARCAAPAGIVGLMRTDSERRPDAESGHRLFDNADVMDWQKESELRAFFNKVRVGLGMPFPFHATKWARTGSFDSMALHRVALGFTQLDQAEVVVTDRLHGHIMSTLLGKPHVVIDNFYGKIANFIKAFGKDDVTLQARDYAEAREMADQLLKRVRSAP